MRGFFAALAALMAVVTSGCSAADTGSTADKTTKTTTTTTAAVGGLPPGVKFDAYDMPDGQRVEASFDVADRGLGLRSSAQQDTIEILRHVKATSPNVHFVLITGYGQVKDDYGNTARRAVLALNYERATIDKINFDAITRSTIWDIRDGGGGLRSDFTGG